MYKLLMCRCEKDRWGFTGRYVERRVGEYCPICGDVVQKTNPKIEGIYVKVERYPLDSGFWITIDELKDLLKEEC